MKGSIFTLLTQDINFLLTAVSYNDTYSERKMYGLHAEHLRPDFLQRELEVNRERGLKSYDQKMENERKGAESSVRLFLAKDSLEEYLLFINSQSSYRLTIVMVSNPRIQKSYGICGAEI